MVVDKSFSESDYTVFACGRCGGRRTIQHTEPELLDGEDVKEFLIGIDAAFVKYFEPLRNEGFDSMTLLLYWHPNCYKYIFGMTLEDGRLIKTALTQYPGYDPKRSVDPKLKSDR